MTHMSNVAALNELTPRQSEILRVLREFPAENGFPPSVRDIAAETGIKSPSTVHAELRALERLRLISRSAGRSRTTRALECEVAA